MVENENLRENHSLKNNLISFGQEKVLHSFPSVQEPVSPSVKTLGETCFCRLGIKLADRASTATTRDLHRNRTGHPRLPYGASTATGVYLLVKKNDKKSFFEK